MFTPSRDEVRQFFFDAWRKHRARAPLVGLEAIAVDIMLMHPELHALLADPDAAERDYSPESGAANPFLHLSLHLAIAEQLSIDQPPGIRSELERIATAHGDRHEALHAVLECLGEVVWRAQREGGTPDGAAYLECLRRAR